MIYFVIGFYSHIVEWTGWLHVRCSTFSHPEQYHTLKGAFNMRLSLSVYMLLVFAQYATNLDFVSNNAWVFLSNIGIFLNQHSR